MARVLIDKESLLDEKKTFEASFSFGGWGESDSAEADVVTCDDIDDMEEIYLTECSHCKHWEKVEKDYLNREEVFRLVDGRLPEDTISVEHIKSFYESAFRLNEHCGRCKLTGRDMDDYDYCSRGEE